MAENYDFNKICRVCLEDGNMMPIFKVGVSKKIMACASVQVWQNDGLPGQICSKCLAKLHIAYQFRKLCEKSDSKLRHNLIFDKSPDKNKKQSEIEQQETLHLQPVAVTSQPQNCIFIECGRTVGLVQEQSIPFTNVHQQTSAAQINYVPSDPLQIGNYNIQNYQSYSLPTQNTIDTNQVLVSTQQQPCIANKSNFTHHELQNKDKIEAKNNDESSLNKSDDSNKCSVCHKLFSNSVKLVRHMKIHSKERPYKCYVCNKAFVHNGNYKIHLRMHTDERPFKCTVCNKGCRQAQDLEKHMRIHTGERPHKCTMCPKAFTTSSNLIAHIRTHTGEKPYVCCVCQKGFCQSNELTKHMRTHTGEKSHICDICQKGFNGSSTLIVHRRSHTGERPFVCDICNKAFKQNAALMKHYKAYHKYNCSQCDLLFVTQSDLKEHTDMHGNKLFACEICEHSFETKDELDGHICGEINNFKELEIEQKVFVCHICRKQFFSSDELESHHVDSHINGITEMGIVAT